MGESAKHQYGSDGYTVVTGAAGFIGSRLVTKLREQRGNSTPLLLVDDMEFFSTRSCCEPFRAMKGLKFLTPSDFLNEIERGQLPIREIFHMGACSRTDEMRETYLAENNTRYSERVWTRCMSRGIDLYYASSAATYGNGENGYVDDPALIPTLHPMNPYGWSKQRFDQFVLGQLAESKQPPHWAGFKFFNVYGPGEEHKGSQATALLHAFNQFSATGIMKLFRSHKEGVADGCQMRDFVHVDDVCSVMMNFSQEKLKPGIYNIGTGRARSFLDLTRAAAIAMGIECKIEWIDTPERLRAHYQYFTEAELTRLRAAGYTAPFIQIEEGAKLSYAEWKTRHLK
ncbi:MAG: ADP-glyceromanno-heptose 6-epimerase [Bdellovibrionota bacterium]